MICVTNQALLLDRLRIGAELIFQIFVTPLIPCFNELTVGDAKYFRERQSYLVVGGWKPKELTRVSSANGPSQDDFVSLDDDVINCGAKIREFSRRPVQREIIENVLRAAGTAPGGANMQPWHFVAVSNPDIKKPLEQIATFKD